MINRVENVLFNSEQVTVIVDRARTYSQRSTCFIRNRTLPIFRLRRALSPFGRRIRAQVEPYWGSK